MTFADSNKYVTILYNKLLGRAPDELGLEYYSAILEQTQDLRLVVDALLGSEEYFGKSQGLKHDAVFALGRPSRPVMIVDVGAQKLAYEDHIYAPLLRSGLEWRCIGFEPLEDHRNARAEAERDSRLSMIDAYIGDGARHLFRELSDPGSSSLLELNDAFVADYEHIHTLNTVGEQEVVTSRLDDVLSDVDNIDFLKFDIQGFETRALGGATDVIARTSVVHCECMFGPMYKGQGYFADIDHILRSAGFDFIDFTYLARYRYVSVPKPSSYGERLIWADAVYFRKLDHTTDGRDTFLAQAAIAELVYKKPGLAQSIIR